MYKRQVDALSLNSINSLTSIEKLEDSFLEKYFENRVEGFIEKGDRYFKRVYRAIILGESRETVSYTHLQERRYQKM